MSVLEFILGVFITIAVVLVLLGAIGMKYNYLELEEKNKKLQDDLIKARAKKIKKEYKKNKIEKREEK